jgi:hypothetical protein
MPLTAVLLFGAGPAETRLLTAAGAAPTLLLNLPAGAWVDRLPRRRVRMVAGRRAGPAAERQRRAQPRRGELRRLRGVRLARQARRATRPRAALLETTLVTLLALALLVRSPVPALRDATAATRPTLTA